MKSGEIYRTLVDIFNKKLTNERKRHIVFWYDEQKEFKEEFEALQFDHVRKWHLTKHNLFATKYELEKKDPHSHFLIYANFPKPLPREDWLYDQFKLGYEFATDKTTVTMRELNVNDESLRETFINYKTFFNNKVRTQAFRRFKIEAYTEEIIDLTILAVLSKSSVNHMDEILKTLFKKHLTNDHAALEAIQKYGNEEKLWSLIEKNYGYVGDQSLNSLITFLMLTYLNAQNHTIVFPEEWESYLGNRMTNVVVFIDQWMNHREDRAIYNALSDQIADVLQINQIVKGWDIIAIEELDAFRHFDEMVIQYLSEQLTEDLSDFDHYLDLLTVRRKLHWYPEYQLEYEAIYFALKLKCYLHDIDYFIPEQSAQEMFETYANKYYQVDQYYRNFYLAYDQVEHKDRVHQLQEKVENLYVNRFVGELAVKWVGSLKQTGQMTWPITGIAQQKDFYHDWVRPYQHENERVFVIISDALRYEVADELVDRLNNERKASAEINAVQGVLPSYTALGMASLLPYQEMEYNKDGRVCLDGKNSTSSSDREAILSDAVADSLVIPYQKVISMNRNTLRETMQGKKVIYIYHNSIDARGDHAATEVEVFSAAEDAIDDIRALVNRLVTNISASNILITADHGFLYQRNSLDNSQKLPDKVDQALFTKRRFSLMRDQGQVEGTLTYSLDYLLKQDQKLFVSVPQGINRFRIQGAGDNYVHGGAMLQEIVIPVITFKNDRSQSLKNVVSKVDVKLTTPLRKITNPMTFLEFLQTEKVEDKRLPRRLIVYFVNDQGEQISNKNIIIADKTIAQVGKRTFREKFVFRSLKYSKHDNYYLTLVDEQSNEIYERYTFMIDIA